MICITSKVLVRMCHSRNEPVYFPAHGTVVGKPRISMAQYAPGCTPPPRVGLAEWRKATTNAIRRYCRRGEASSGCEAGEVRGASRFGVVIEPILYWRFLFFLGRRLTTVWAAKSVRICATVVLGVRAGWGECGRGLAQCKRDPCPRALRQSSSVTFPSFVLQVNRWRHEFQV